MPLRLVPQAPQIEDLDGFSKTDIFGARETGERLANIVGDLEGHSVIALDGPWGSGKSVFVRQWAGLLRQRGHPVVYFDAFEHDHLNDAFFPLFGHLLQASDSRGSALTTSRQSLIARAVPLVKAMPSMLSDVALRMGTGGMVSMHDLRDALERSKSGQPSAIDDMIKDSICNANLQVACVQAFREEIGGAVAALGDRGSAKLPLVLIIDELDRCRPSYALSVLERMKHVFAADGICFVLVTHLKGLAEMVTRQYGLDDAKQYLDKFFHLRFDIRSLLFRHSGHVRTKYLDHLGSKLDVDRKSSLYTTVITNSLVEVNDVPLRSQERIMLNLALFDRAMVVRKTGRGHIAGDRECRISFAAGMCFMREMRPELFLAASKESLEYGRANELLKFDQWSGADSATLLSMALCWKLATLGGDSHLTDEDKTFLPRYEGLLVSYRRVLAMVCADIDQLWQ